LDLVLTSNRDPAKATECFDVQNILDEVFRREHDGIGDEAVFVTLNTPNHLGLGGRRLVVMDNANTTK
jgi:hypothetical protein